MLYFRDAYERTGSRKWKPRHEALVLLHYLYLELEYLGRAGEMSRNFLVGS